jgi:transcriptional regulator with XRE-family HTH domain
VRLVVVSLQGVTWCEYMADDRSPTLRRRELGRRLRDLRADRTIQEVADALGVSPPTISRMETGARTATRRNVLALCDLYGVDDSLRTQLLNLVREASAQGWWHKYDDLAIDPLIGLEIEAFRISSYEPCVIPWMYQTGEYARSVIRRTAPRMADNVLEERVEARLTRQELLTRESPPYFWSVVDESALRRRVGGAEVMRDQLSRMFELSALPHVTLQVVPFSLGAYPGLKNAFTFLEFRPPQSPVVFIESTAGNLYLERTADLDIHEESLQHLRADALDPDSSMHLIKEVKKTFEP